MKKVCMYIGLLLSCLTMAAQKNEVYVETAGSLADVLRAEGLSEASQLTVRGELNGDDIRQLRTMMGGWLGLVEGGVFPGVNTEDGYVDFKLDELDVKPTYCLKELDLSEARIVAGGNLYVFLGAHSDLDLVLRKTEADVVSEMMFAFCETIETLALPKSAVRVEDGVFSHCPNLREVKLSAGKVNGGTDTFENCQLLTLLSISAELPPVMDMPLDSDTYANCTLEVPAGTKGLYAETEGWSRFQTIVEAQGGQTSVEGIRADAGLGAETVYSADGKRQTSARGLNIVKDGSGNTRKVLVK